MTAETTAAGMAMRQVAIVGAGIAGLGLGIRLKRSGQDDFVILERGADVGGTWRDNVYPGASCDIPSTLYEYSFRPNPLWSRRFAPGAEIHRYLRDAAEQEGLLPHLRLDCAVNAARWDAEDECWRLDTADGPVRARVLVMAAGRLSEPRLPEVSGLDEFEGRAFHSSRWDRRSLTDLRVGVVGTGASAVQLIPEIASDVESLVVFQRSPAWVLPRNDRGYTATETRPGRAELARDAEELFAARLHGSPAAAELERTAREHLHAQVPAGRLRDSLTPDYEIGCKRAVFSNSYFPALQRPNVVLEPSALQSVDRSGVTSADGQHHEVDVLIFATGFETTQPPFARIVTGRTGSLAEHWSAGMTSYASTVVHGFPNLFVLDGPNSALGHHSAFEVIEAQFDYVLGALDHLRTVGYPLEVTRAAEESYTELIDRLAARTVWLHGNCSSWYRDESSNRLTLVWPERATTFRRLNSTFDPSVFQPLSTRVS
ncbi:MAG TPA: NAD(P)/FAD-dependent oxidoreductase [Flexivirga sp.]|uniref:flavin-containing monooxygenase n=1 Tax=Flexivirga sp. TaxID=1962927 RepID=UPI002C0B0FE9|nr:NAD(P)/FAD-dependent oxidoreductase [Flexivirga sp.]HWC21024.1 NAD(P)/FAD-dependent oxidoreductase [Flexivirga sp.]